jgi:hypothetical protein
VSRHRPAPDRFTSPAVPKELGLLFSFHYMGERSLVGFLASLGHRPRVFVDSGGFSAFTQGAAVDLLAYARWLRANASGIDHYASLDVIGDPRGTLVNQIRLEREGLRPLPIVHFGTDSSEVERYADRGYPYLCLGGMVPHLGSMSQALRFGKDHPGLVWLRACHEVAQRVGVGLHGFGVTSWSLVKGFPWRSVDSSSWSSAVRYGRLSVFDPTTGEWTTTPIRDVAKVMALSPLLRSYGVEPTAIVRDAEETRRFTVIAAVRSWVAASRWLTEQRHPVDVYTVTPGVETTTDHELRNAVRIAMGASHERGIVS